MRQSKNKRLAKKKCDKYFSKYIRLKFASNGRCQCVTCGKWVSIEKADTGHFMSRRYEATRYDEKNTAPQCRSCNRFNQGRQFKFAQWIDKTYGEGTAEQLEIKSKMTCQRKKWHYEELAKEFKSKIENL